MFRRHGIMYVLIAAVIGSSIFFYCKLSRQMKSVVHYSKRSYHFLSSSGSQPPIERVYSQKKAYSSRKLCHRLNKLPFGEDSGLVLGVKKIELEEIAAPYNASLIENGDGYLLFFRYDVPGFTMFQSLKFPFKSYIGVVPLDEEFRQAGQVRTIATGSDFSEDPRVIRSGNRLFLSYNDIAENTLYSRTMRLASLDPENFSIQYTLDLDQHIQPVEKNWVPFVCQEQGEDRIFFGYSINPHKILKLKDQTQEELSHERFANKSCWQKLPWLQAWGPLRGGTPAQLVDGQYLAFFHSSFKQDGAIWYVMAAYTFEAKPPFRVLSVSEYPILFQGIYDTPPQNTAHEKLRCIFPSGFVLSRQGDKEVIHVSCGENDCATKIITLDKEVLMKSLVPVSPNP